MKTPIIKAVRNGYQRQGIEPFELIIDFNNDRHHAVRIDKGLTKNQIVDLLMQFATQIKNDKYLDTSQDNDPGQ